MPPRLYVDQPLTCGSALVLPSGPARHVQVLRLQPGDKLTLFNGRGGEWRATVGRMGRSEVQVRIDEHDAVDRELALPVTLALGMPANERMDSLIEKATELGAAAIQPLVCQRSVLRLSGPEGGLTEAEEASARSAAFVPVCLGPRVLRADTAPLALLAHLALSAPASFQSP